MTLRKSQMQSGWKAKAPIVTKTIGAFCAGARSANSKAAQSLVDIKADLESARLYVVLAAFWLTKPLLLLESVLLAK